MPIRIPPPLEQVGAPAHVAQHVKFYLNMNGKRPYLGYWTDMTFTPEIEISKYKPAGAGHEYGIKGLSRVNGTLNRGHINTELLKDFADAMMLHCEPLPTYTLSTEICFPDGTQKRSTIVIYQVEIPSLTVTYPMADLATESVPFTGQYYEIFDFANGI
jgi:hypothetical protein